MSYVVQPGDLAAVVLTVCERYKKLGFNSPVVSAVHRDMNWFDVKVSFMENDRVDYLTVLVVNGEVQIQG